MGDFMIGMKLEVVHYEKAPKPAQSAAMDWGGFSYFSGAGPTGIEPATSDVTGRRSNLVELQPQMNH
jgi:hypothetical protein